MADDLLAELQRAVDAAPAAPSDAGVPAALEEAEAIAAGHEQRMQEILREFLDARAAIGGQALQQDRDAEIARIKAEAGL